MKLISLADGRERFIHVAGNKATLLLDTKPKKSQNC